MGVSARTIGMRQDYIFNNLDNIKCNLGQITFEYFYENFKKLVPEYANEIQEEFDKQVAFMNIEREQKRGLKGTTKLELYYEQMSMFPLS